MHNKQFDEMILRRIQTERIYIGREAETRMYNKLQNKAWIQEHTATRRRPLRMAVAVIAALALLTGTAFAAVRWGSRLLLSHEGPDGQVKVNEALASQIQPIDDFFIGEALSVEVVDAVFDGRVLTAAWTLTNNAQERIYLACNLLVNQAPLNAGSYNNVERVFVEPGETIHSGFSARVEEGAEGAALEQCDIQMHFTALALNGEVVEVGGVSDASPKAVDEYRARIQAVIAQGNIPVAPDGEIELSGSASYNLALTMVQNLEASGLMRSVGAVDTAFSVQRAAAALPAGADGILAQRQNDGYTLRVTRADIGLNYATIQVERVFENQAAADRFKEFFDPMGPSWNFYFLDEAGDIWWASISSGDNDTKEPQLQPDGTLVWAYTGEMTELARIPQRITVVPARDNSETGEAMVTYPDEGVEFVVKQAQR